MKQARKIKMVIFISLMFAMWFLLPYKKFIAGLGLAISTGAYNAYILRMRMRRAEHLIYTGKQKVWNNGLTNRLFTMMLAITIALYFPQVFDVITVACAIPICYVIGLSIMAKGVNQSRGINT